MVSSRNWGISRRESSPRSVIDLLPPSTSLRRAAAFRNWAKPSSVTLVPYRESSVRLAMSRRYCRPASVTCVSFRLRMRKLGSVCKAARPASVIFVLERLTFSRLGKPRRSARSASLKEVLCRLTSRSRVNGANDSRAAAALRKPCKSATATYLASPPKSSWSLPLRFKTDSIAKSCFVFWPRVAPLGPAAESGALGGLFRQPAASARTTNARENSILCIRSHPFTSPHTRQQRARQAIFAARGVPLDLGVEEGFRASGLFPPRTRGRFRVLFPPFLGGRVGFFSLPHKGEGRGGGKCFACGRLTPYPSSPPPEGGEKPTRGLTQSRLPKSRGAPRATLPVCLG